MTITCAAASPELSIVIPAYNEEERLQPTVREILGFLDVRGIRGEVLVVDDGSRDRTVAVAESCAARDARVRVFKYGVNRGKGFAVKTGVLGSSGRTVLFSDADLSTPIHEIDLLWPKLRGGCDVVIASRHLEASRILVRQPLHRRYLGRFFNGMISLLGVRGFADTQCGFKLFRAEAARRVFGALRTEGFAFDVEILMRARKLGLRIAEVPVRWINSSLSRVHPVRDSVRMTVEILRLRGIL